MPGRPQSLEKLRDARQRVVRASLDRRGVAQQPCGVAAPLHQAVTRLEAVRARGSKKADLEAAVDTFLDVYALSQHALRLPRIDRALPAGLPEGIELDEQRVSLGNDAKGAYVGLVQRRKGREKQVTDTP